MQDSVLRCLRLLSIEMSKESWSFISMYCHNEFGGQQYSWQGWGLGRKHWKLI
jgi:hypothetical protein